jgi:hypothetical protein
MYGQVRVANELKKRAISVCVGMATSGAISVRGSMRPVNAAIRT